MSPHPSLAPEPDAIETAPVGFVAAARRSTSALQLLPPRVGALLALATLLAALLMVI